MQAAEDRCAPGSDPAEESHHSQGRRGVCVGGGRGGEGGVGVVMKISSRMSLHAVHAAVFAFSVLLRFQDAARV